MTYTSTLCLLEQGSFTSSSTLLISTDNSNLRRLLISLPAVDIQDLDQQLQTLGKKDDWPKRVTLYNPLSSLDRYSTAEHLPTDFQIPGNVDIKIYAGHTHFLTHPEKTG